MFVLYQAFLLAHNMLILTEDGIVNGVTSKEPHHIECCCNKEEREFKRLQDLYGGILNPSEKNEKALTPSKNRPFYKNLFAVSGDTRSTQRPDEPFKQYLYSSFSNDMYIKCSYWKCPKIYHMKCFGHFFIHSEGRYLFNKYCPCNVTTAIDFNRFYKRHTDEYAMGVTKQMHYFERLYMLPLLTGCYFCDLLKHMNYTLENTGRLIKRLEAEKNPNKTQLLVSARLYSAIIDQNTTVRELCKALASQLKMMDPSKVSKFLHGRNFLSEKVKNEQLGPDEVKTIIFALIRDSPNYLNWDSDALYKMLLKAYMATEPSPAQILDFFSTFLFSECSEILVNFHIFSEAWNKKMPSFAMLYQRIENKLLLRDTYKTLQYEYFFNNSIDFLKKYAKFKRVDMAILVKYLTKRLYTVKEFYPNATSDQNQAECHKYNPSIKSIKAMSNSSFGCFSTFENILFYASVIDDSNSGTDKVIDLVRYFVYDSIIDTLLSNEDASSDFPYENVKVAIFYEKRLKQPIMRYAYLAEYAKYVSNTLSADKDISDLQFRYSDDWVLLTAYRSKYPQDFASLCIETQKLPGKLPREQTVEILLRGCTKLDTFIIANIEYLNNTIFSYYGIPECVLEDYKKHSYASLATAGFSILYIEEDHKIFENLTRDDIFHWCTKHCILEYIDGIKDKLAENKQDFSKFIQLYFPFILEWIDSLHSETSTILLSDNMLKICDLACLYGKYDHVEISGYLARTKNAFYFINKFLLHINASSRRDVLTNIFIRLSEGTSSNTNDLLTAMAKYLEVSYAMDIRYKRGFDLLSFDLRKDGIVICGFKELNSVNLYGALANCSKEAVLELFIKHKEFSEKFLEHVFHVPRSVIDKLRLIPISKKGLECAMPTLIVSSKTNQIFFHCNAQH
ncbi:hypothetical protein ENBRE01_1850 [Enteropsectra breve]|nr:hypothetical protein ENBRE01_1850 [Enteropsectra breve]